MKKNKASNSNERKTELLQKAGEETKKFAVCSSGRILVVDILNLKATISNFFQ